jgi:DegV family protein with EDD domain
METKKIKFINSSLFSEGIKNGIFAVVNAQEKLNSINVFPVADGDTGTNLCLSLYPIINITNSQTEETVGSLLEKIADKLIDHSRGNSGSILAQFFQGMSDSAVDIEQFDTYQFLRSLKMGNRYAREALSEPVDGTILTVIDKFSESFEDSYSNETNKDFSEIFSRVMVTTKEAVAETKNQLDVLRDSNVEDAGAKGFYILMNGFVEFIVNGVSQKEPSSQKNFLDHQPEEIYPDSDEIEFQYCTECIISGNEIDRRKIKEILLKHGNSIVVAGTKNKIKAHIHTDNPSFVFDEMKKFGTISSEKADDMKKQNKIIKNQNKSFAVITDSAADITDEDIEELDINIIPIRIQLGQKSYLDKVTITPDEFFKELLVNTAQPTTSQPSVGEFRRHFQYLASHYNNVLSISVTGSISGTLQASESAAKKIKADGNIFTYNSLNASLGQGQIAVYAAKCAKNGKDIHSTLEELNTIRKNTITFGLIPNLKYAVQGGRVPKTVKLIADIFRLTPILVSTDDGFIVTKKFLFGKNHILKRFAKYIAKNTSCNKKINISIGHAIAYEDAKTLKKFLETEIEQINEFKITELGTAIGVHGGPGAIVVGVQTI